MARSDKLLELANVLNALADDVREGASVDYLAIIDDVADDLRDYVKGII